MAHIINVQGGEDTINYKIEIGKDEALKHTLPVLSMALITWFKYLLLILLGLSFPFIAYKIDESITEETYIQERSPLVKMPVVHRVKGWGTVKFPNKIYVRYRGKRYSLATSNQYFSSTASLDSIVVHYDSVRDKAVLAGSKITRPYVLLVLIALCGVATVSATVVDLRRQLIKRRNG